MKFVLLFAVILCTACVQGAPLEAANIQTEIDQADPRSVLSSSSHHIPNDDPLVSIFVDILHDGDSESDSEQSENKEASSETEVAQSPKETLKKSVAAVEDDETPEDEVDEELDNRIGRFVNIHVAIDNRGNGNGDGLVNIPA